MIEQEIEAVLAVRWHDAAEIAAADHEAIGENIAKVFEDLSFAALPVGDQISFVRHVFALYASSWHSRGRAFVEPIEAVFALGLKSPQTSLDDLCAIYDALFFLYWYSDVSLDGQQGFARGAVAPLVRYLEQQSQIDATAQAASRLKKPIRVGYLSQFGAFGAANPMTPAAFDFLTGLTRHYPTQYDTTLIAWMFHDEPSARRFEAEGVKVVRIDGNSTLERIATVEAAISDAGIDVLISDMNTALPTVIFERRVAPIQVHYQLGMPFWALRNLDAAFRVWNTEPSRVGLAHLPCFQLNGAWDLPTLAPPVEQAAVQALREDLSPNGGLIIGAYGRLAKVTPDYLSIVEALVKRNPDVTVAIGGSGDPTAISSFIAERGLESRVRLIGGYVDGHLWGHVLDVFLDTFPLHGGASCREVIAKGVPVVSMHDADMPNLSEEERVSALVATSIAEYQAIALRLVEDRGFLQAARLKTQGLARSRPGESAYAAKAHRAIQALVRRHNRRHAVDWLRSLSPRAWLQKDRSPKDGATDEAVQHDVVA